MKLDCVLVVVESCLCAPWHFPSWYVWKVCSTVGLRSMCEFLARTKLTGRARHCFLSVVC